MKRAKVEAIIPNMARRVFVLIFATPMSCMDRYMRRMLR
jgi:hypothetical protein